VFTLYQIPFANGLDRVLYDLHLNQQMTDVADEQVVIANIDEKSIAQLGQWPWRRDVLAQFVDTAFEHYQIKALGFDVVFAEQSDSTAQEVMHMLAQSDLSQHDTFKQAQKLLAPQLDFDQQLTDSFVNRNVVLGIVFEQNKHPNTNTLPLPITSLSNEMKRNHSLISAQSYIANIPSFHEQARSAGFFDNPLLDADGILRRVPLVQSIKGHIYPSLALELYRLTVDEPSIKIGLEQINDEYQIKQINIGQKSVQVGRQADVLVPYIGPQRSFAYLPIIDILSQKLPVEALKNKTVIVGTDSAGLLDLRSTPFSKAYPGVEVHANVVSGLLNNRMMTVPDYALSFEVVTILLCTLALFLVELFRDPRAQIVGTLSVVALLLFINQYFWAQGIVLPLASSLLLSFGLFISLNLINIIVETRQRQSIVHMFGQYVPPELVKQMSMAPERYNLRSENKTLTVLFTDIRDFTSTSEKMPPEQLSDYLNRFLTAMTEVIHENGGTIDKYMGDAIMAFWGAPIASEDHAKQACHAACGMHKRLVTLNQDLVAEGLPEIKIGIGINTDVMFVGNMGSSFRMAYTVIGDAVNLAARLEALTKQYGVFCLIGEQTANQINNDELDVFPIDSVRVKGKSKPVTIYQLSDCLDQTFVQSFRSFLSSYQQQDWPNALVEIDKLYENFPAHSVLIELYAQRTKQFAKFPPGPGWDGVYNHLSK
jgi:adenylate cyclase